MSGAQWAYVPTGSGPGHLQRVAGDLQYNRVQRAYRAYTGHGTSCPTCAVDAVACPTAEQLWGAYRAARG